MFPLLIWELFSETVSVTGIPDGGTEPDFLVLFIFLNLSSFPCHSPLGTTYKGTLWSHRAVSLPHLSQPALCTRGHQKTAEAVYSLLYSIAHRSLETQIQWKGKHWTKWLSAVSAFWSRKQESEQDWEMPPNFSSAKTLTFQKKSMPIS